MLKSNFLLTTLLLLLVCLPSFAQDDDGKKDKKEKKVKVKKVKTPKVKKDKADTSGDDASTSDFDDDYPYPEVRDAEYSDFIKPKHQEQQDKFLDDKYMYPAPPKNQWEIGLDIGPLWISGDVKTRPFPGLAIGGHVRKSFGYVFSLRGSIMGGTTKGANWQASQGWSAYASNDETGQSASIFAEPGEYAPNAALAGGARYEQFTETDRGVPDYRNVNSGGGNLVFHNYKTRLWEGVISGVVNLNNIKFHKRRNNWAWHGFAGIGGVLYNVKMDQLDGDGNEYDYTAITDYDQEETAADIREALNDLRDGEYESQAEKHFDDYWILGSSRDGDHEWSYRPTAHIGLGTQYKITNMINLGLETKVTYTNDDLLDGQRWEEWTGLTRDYDTYVFTNLSLNVNLGAKNSVEPLWWMNPLDYGYKEMNDCNCEIPEPVDLSDCDNDGVPDLWDLEKCESRPECPVDTHGVELDSDGDGIKDCDDCQPHTPRHLIDKISECGEAFDDPCPDCPHRHNENDIDYNVSPCEDSYLPNILFNNGSSSVRDEFQPQLQQVADYLRANPDTRICVVGHTDSAGSSRANDCISYKRAESVINELVTKYGIPRSQLILQYRGANEPVIGGDYSGSGKGKTFDAPNALNRRVDFKCCEGSYDMPRPAGCK